MIPSCKQYPRMRSSDTPLVCLQQLSNTQDLIEAGRKKIALPPASELALPSDNPKLDSTWLNVTHLREYLTESYVWWLILKRKSHEIPTIIGAFL